MAKQKQSDVFEVDILGHEKQIAHIKELFSRGAMPAVWMFSGKKGIGKARVALDIACHILSQGRSTSLDRVLSGSHPDFLYITSDKTTSSSGAITVDQVRQMSDFFFLTASESDHKVVIVDDIDAANANAANAMLKTLEEPRCNAFLFLISHNPHSVIDTIRSRCQSLRFNNLQRDDCEAILRGKCPQINATELEQLMEIDGSSPGQLIDIYENDGLQIYGKIVEILSSLPNIDRAEIHKMAKTINKDNEHIFMLILLHILMKIIKTNVGADTAYQKGIKDLSEYFKANYSSNELLVIFDDINQLGQDAKQLYLDYPSTVISIFNKFTKQY